MFAKKRHTSHSGDASESMLRSTFLTLRSLPRALPAAESEIKREERPFDVTPRFTNSTKSPMSSFDYKSYT